MRPKDQTSEVEKGGYNAAKELKVNDLLITVSRSKRGGTGTLCPTPLLDPALNVTMATDMNR